jgi:hypothetical protein
MFAVLEKVLKSRHVKQQTDREAYVELVHKAARLDADTALSEADQSKLDKVSAALDIPLEEIGRQILAIQAHRKAKADSVGLAEARSALQAATMAKRNFAAERKRITDELNDREHGMMMAQAKATDAVNTREKAAKIIAELESDFPELLAASVSPAQTVAHLMPNRGDLMRGFDLRLNSLEHQKPTDLEAQRRALKVESEATLARFDELKKTIGAATVFYLTDVDLDPSRSEVNLNMSDFDFRPAKGQDLQQFDNLLARLNLARQAVIERNKVR